VDIEKEIEKMTLPVKKRLAQIFSSKKEPFEVYGLLKEFMQLQGKFIRPALCIASCKAVGGSPKKALHAACAIELFHNFTLIHDDIEDNSLLRRGVPCLHVKYGLPLAINAGDGLFMTVWKEALKIESKFAQERLLEAFTKVLEGQAIELGWYRDNNWDVDEKDYFKMVEGKTAALIGCACELGAYLGNADKKTIKKLSDFGIGIGVGFQIIDDVLNIIGDEKKYGKEIGGDIAEGKRTLMTIRALKNLDEKKSEQLKEILKKKEKTNEEIKKAIELLKESGAVESAKKTADEKINSALKNLEVLNESKEKEILIKLANYIAKRQK
jgi:geranylgeranyl diphosphate synthase type I